MLNIESLCNSVFQRQTGGISMFRVSSTTRLLFEGNTISRAGHSPLQFYPHNTNQYIVIRGNVFHAVWGRNFEFFHDRDVLFEHNIIAHAFNSGWSGSSNAKLGFTRGIVRFNRIFRNPHGAISMYPWPKEGQLSRMRLYNNVWDDTGQRPISIRSNSKYTQDIVLMNNIFSRNDPYGPPGRQHQISLEGGTPEQVRLLRNVFTGIEPGLQVVRDYSRDFTVQELHSKQLQAEHGVRYEDNLDVNPGYLDPDNYNHALRNDSPLRNSGSFLTTARGDGAGTLLTVYDAAFFYDGFGIEGEVGDVIGVGRTGQQARVLAVDHEANTLLLEHEVRWRDGDPVSLPWSGDAPDIGVYEHGDQGRVAVQVVTEPFMARPGEVVRLHAVTHGAAQPQQVRWWLGDCGRKIRLDCPKVAQASCLCTLKAQAGRMRHRLIQPDFVATDPAATLSVCGLTRWVRSVFRVCSERFSAFLGPAGKRLKRHYEPGNRPHRQALKAGNA